MKLPWDDLRIAANDRPVRDNFHDWFAQSKVVDENGLPLMVYHGSRSDFDTFITKRGGSGGAAGQGAYFSPDPRAANQYAMLNGAHGGGSIIPVYLRLINPYRAYETEDIPKRKQLERSGHDGIIYTHSWNDGSVSVEYIAFEATQIKSAIGNCGLYLKGNASLTDLDVNLVLRQAQTARNVVHRQPSSGRMGISR